MGRRNFKYLRAILALLLAVQLINCLGTRAESSTTHQEIYSVGTITYPTPPSDNLAVIPDAWRWGYYGDVPLYVFVDYSVTHNGHPSLRLERGGGIDPFGLLDRSAWTNEPFGFSVKPGDHVVARCWIRTDPSSTGNTNAGARIGVDLWGGGSIVDGYPGNHITDGSEWVHWGTSAWTLREYDFIVPATVFTKDQTGKPISPTQINMIVMWAQAIPGDDNGSAWFSDAELYINP